MASAKQIVMAGAGMSQSSMMGAALIAGFVVFLAAKGKLGAYWSLLLGGSASGGNSSSGGSSAGGSGASSPASPPATPGLSLNPFAGLPTSICQFLGNCPPAAPAPAPPSNAPPAPSGAH